MRRVLCAAVVLTLASPAFAGDFDVLRGPEPTYHWSGFYAGAQGGFSSSVVNLGPAAGPDIGYLLRESAIEQDQQISQWPVLGAAHPEAGSYGGFVGYNYEWQGLVFGGEVGYFHSLLSASSNGGLTRNFTDSGNLPAHHNYYYTMSVSGNASLTMSDFTTFRARAGWEAGQFLPYIFGGLALSRASVTSSATVQYTATDYPDSEEPPLTPLDPLAVGPLTQGSNNNTFAYGADMGVGVDVALLKNFFVRGEFEYIYFAPINGIPVSVSTARIGGAFKF